MNGFGDYELLDLNNIVQMKRDPRSEILLYLPSLSSVQRLTTAELRSFERVGMRWVSHLEESKFSYQVRPAQRNINKMIIEKCTTEESC